VEEHTFRLDLEMGLLVGSCTCGRWREERLLPEGGFIRMADELEKAHREHVRRETGAAPGP
jgi:hypothetical protein